MFFKCGHPRTLENTIRNGEYSYCRACKNARNMLYYRAKNGIPLDGAKFSSKRKTHCVNGHERPSDLKGTCPICATEAAKRRYAKNKDAVCARFEALRCKRKLENPEEYLRKQRDAERLRRLADPEKHRLRQASYRKKNHTALMARRASDRQCLKDYVVRGTLVKEGWDKEFITLEIMEVRRLLIILRREVKNGRP